MREMVFWGWMDGLEWKGENLGKEVSMYVPSLPYLTLNMIRFFGGRWIVGWGSIYRLCMG